VPDLEYPDGVWLARRLLSTGRRGEIFFCIGMSEPDSGSDLASIRTRAEPVADGYEVTGAKVWTSYAHESHFAITLVRTSPAEANRHRGLSQLILDLKAPGVTIRPIINLAGEHVVVARRVRHRSPLVARARPRGDGGRARRPMADHHCRMTATSAGRHESC
jgi:alkylation response protein AidB-like acyl-CoA dehydrogenase